METKFKSFSHRMIRSDFTLLMYFSFLCLINQLVNGDSSRKPFWPFHGSKGVMCSITQENKTLSLKWACIFSSPDCGLTNHNIVYFHLCLQCVLHTSLIHVSLAQLLAQKNRGQIESNSHFLMILSISAHGRRENYATNTSCWPWNVYCWLNMCALELPKRINAKE